MEHFYHSIHGYFNYENLYRHMIAFAPTNTAEKFVEIGVWKGKSISYAAVEIINSGKNITIDAIDTFAGSPNEPVLMDDKSVVNKTLYEEYLQNIEPVKSIVTTYPFSSIEASKLYEDNSLFFVFIDEIGRAHV